LSLRHRHHFAGSETFQHAQKLTPVGLRAAGPLAVDFRAPFGTELFKLRVKSLAVGADAGVSEAAAIRNPLWNARRLMALVGGRNCGNSLQPVDLIPETTMQEQFMKLFPILFMISTTLGAAFAQETSTSGANAETAPAPEIEACRASGLIALKERSAAVKDVSLDLDSVRLIKVNSKIENIDIKAIVLGDANIEKKKSDKAQNFICIVGEKGKVLLTIFSDQ
jgi:hypothetical protein